MRADATMAEAAPTYPSWADVLAARDALDDVELELSAVVSGQVRNIPDEFLERDIKLMRILAMTRTRLYRDLRDLYFVGRREADQQIAADSDKRRDRFNTWIGVFVGVSAFGTLLQAIAAWWPTLASGLGR